MNRAQIIEALRRHRAELEAAGIRHLALFGSAARGDNGAKSDIDLLAALDERKPLSLLDLIHLENLLADILGRPVDLIEEQTLRPPLSERVARESIRAF
jgi:uncharacterized protein